MAILAILNHDSFQVKEALENLGFSFELWMLDPNKEKGKKNIIYGFNNLSELLNAKIFTTPILFETPVVVNHVSLNNHVVYGDAKVLPDGLINFMPLNLERIDKVLRRSFKYSSLNLIQFRKNHVTQHGINSQVALLFNSLLATLPSFSHKITIIALTEAMKTGKWLKFEKYLIDNRLITNQNKEIVFSLGERLKKLEPVIKAIASGNKVRIQKASKLLIREDELYKECIQRIRFYFKFWGHYKLKNFLDDEKNINQLLPKGK